MTVSLVSDKKIAETSSKGNQEKWFDRESGKWYKLDQFGYEALAETVTSALLEHSNIESDTAFTFTRYQMEKLHVHGRDRNGCVSRNFLRPGQQIVTLSHLFRQYLGAPLGEKLSKLSSDKKRLAYLVEETAALTGLEAFPQYLTLLFEVDALVLNEDRHLNNIAVLERGGRFDYCPIFDNGAGLLSNTQIYQMDIDPKALIPTVQARPFNTSFNRQISNARALYGQQLHLPKLRREDIETIVAPCLEYYAARDRGLILDRVCACLLTRQKSL